MNPAAITPIEENMAKNGSGSHSSADAPVNSPTQVRAGKLLEVTALSKAFGGVRAVDQVSFDVAAGELLALIGPNGAGKSTCFNMLNGQLASDSGSVHFDGVGNRAGNFVSGRSFPQELDVFGPG